MLGGPPSSSERDFRWGAKGDRCGTNVMTLCHDTSMSQPEATCGGQPSAFCTPLEPERSQTISTRQMAPSFWDSPEKELGAEI